MSQAEIETRLDIDAPLTAVWQALVDFDGYAQWNPMVLYASGDARADGHASLRYRSSIGVEFDFHVRITVLQPHRELRWTGTSLGIAGDHYFKLASNAGVTRLSHGEVFTGPLAGVLAFMFRKQIPVFDRFNQALAQRAQALAADLSAR